MISLQSRLFLFLTRLRQLRQPDQSHLTYAEQRAHNDQLAAHYILPEDILYEPLQVADRPAAWTSLVGSTSKQVILYWHGGAYVLGTLYSHRYQQARIARFTRARVLQVEYRLAPEEPFPAGLEDACATYHWLLQQGILPEQIVVLGESAGAGLALGMLLALRDAQVPLPAATVCLSPWFDLALSGAWVRTSTRPDFVLTAQRLRLAASAYLGSSDPHTPLASPLYGDLHGLPPLLLQVGTNDALLEDSQRLAVSAQEAGVPVKLTIWPEMPHVWQMAGRWLPEARQAMEQVQHFVAQYTPNEK